MANRNWVKGGSSPNPQGRPKKKRSSPSVARMLERFVARNCSPRKLQQLFDGLKAGEKLTFISDVLPYVVSRKPQAHAVGIGSLNDQQLDQLYESVLSNVGLIAAPEDDSDLIDYDEIKTDSDDQGA